MTFKVVIQPPALTDIEAAYLYIRQQNPRAGDRWLEEMLTAIEELKTFPNRHGLARESDAFDEPIRQLLVGRRQHVYRVLFVIRSNVVRVLHVRHAARR
jgi:plasmid stabilization system protein ParE